MTCAAFGRNLRSVKAMLAYLPFAVVLHVSNATARDDACSAESPPVPPVSDMPTRADRARLRGCNSEALFYGLGMPANPADARLCALIEAEHGGEGLPLQGNGILMMIYANGAATKRNAPLARRYACALGWDANATDALMQRIGRGADPDVALDACEVAPAGTGLDLCALHNEAMRLERIDGDERAIVSRWPLPRRAAFAQLKKAALAYESARAATEISARDSQSLQLSKRSDFRAEFTSLLGTIDAPAAAPSDLKQLDLELNAVYRELLDALAVAQAADSGPPGFLTPTSLRSAERDWLRYADAWESFRSRAGLPLPAAALRKVLTVQRTDALHRSLIELRQAGG